MFIFLDELYFSIQNKIEEDIAKLTENYICLEVADDIKLQQINAIASQSVKTKKINIG